VWLLVPVFVVWIQRVTILPGVQRSYMHGGLGNVIEANVCVLLAVLNAVALFRLTAPARHAPPGSAEPAQPPPRDPARASAHATAWLGLVSGGLVLVGAVGLTVAKRSQMPSPPWTWDARIHVLVTDPIAIPAAVAICAHTFWPLCVVVFAIGLLRGARPARWAAGLAGAATLAAIGVGVISYRAVLVTPTSSGQSGYLGAPAGLFLGITALAAGVTWLRHGPALREPESSARPERP